MNTRTPLAWGKEILGMRRTPIRQHCRFLSVIQSDLDVQLLLETKYNYVHKLREAQAEMEVGGIIIIDQLTVARNHVLVNAELFGGAQEKYVPPWTLNENDPKLISSIPLFAGSMPLPEIYTMKVAYGGQTNTRIGSSSGGISLMHIPSVPSLF